MEHNTRFRVTENTLHREVEDEVVILDTENDSYLGLNGTAATIWTALLSEGTFVAAVRSLVVRFDVDEGRAREDARVLIENLLGRGLIERES